MYEKHLKEDEVSSNKLYKRFYLLVPFTVFAMYATKKYG